VHRLNALEARPRKLKFYQTEKGDYPCKDWLDSYEHQPVFATLQARLIRLRAGNFGAHRSVGKGVVELKIDTGPGYRIYFGQDGDLVILLCGGVKDTQPKDIKTAKKYWEDYNA
jgi:putative addiction module killer protein